MRDTSRGTSSLEVVASLLLLPAPLAAPLLDQAISIGLDEWCCLVVVWLEKKGHTKNRKADGPWSTGKGFGKNTFDGFVQVLLADKSVGSQRVGNELDRNDEGTGRAGGRRCERASGERGGDDSPHGHRRRCKHSGSWSGVGSESFASALSALHFDRGMKRPAHGLKRSGTRSRV